jgi:tetratricopeptide (TPR) repeat protein
MSRKRKVEVRPAAGALRTSAAPSPTATPSRRSVLLFTALALAALLAYQPAWNGAPVWDDDAHLTPPSMQSLDGLRRVWFEPGATQQYYPLVHSAFWLLNEVWGHHTLGYHIVNIVLHALCAFLIAVLLQRLAVAGALLAAVIFALHPVHVESVAWISELKNTLSGVLYLAAALAYLRFDSSRRTGVNERGPGRPGPEAPATRGSGSAYAAALLLFVGALLSKTVTATLPAALLVVFWWRGSLSWRRDVVPLVPFFVLGVAAGLFTVWMEQHVIGAQGSGFEFSFVERCLIAGRAFWFYLGKLLVPVNLMFVYPRWAISQSDASLYFYLLAAIALLAASWWLRHRSRAPLAALLLFTGTLAPALGFFNVFPFRYSFVADHFVYLASVPAIAFAASSLVAGLQHFGRERVEAAAIMAVGIPLGMLTWTQSRQYASADTLLRVTLEKNPSCWMCQNNLAVPLLEGPGERLDEAVRLIESSLRTNPDHAEALNNLGVAYRKMGRVAAAMEAHRKAVQLSPRSAAAHNNLGADAHALGRFEEALHHYRRALELNPSAADAYRNMGATLLQLGRVDEAARHIQRSLELAPQSAEAHHSLGTAMLRAGRTEDAIRHFTEALRIDPGHAGARNNLGMALELSGRLDDAAAAYQEAARIEPGAITFDNLGYVLLRLGRREEAREYFERALRIQPTYAPARINLGNLFYAVRRFPEAIEHYREAVKHSSGNTAAEAHNGLGVVLATTGSLDEAIVHFREALRLRPGYTEAQANLDRALADRRRR